jgi:hypothetical protein
MNHEHAAAAVVEVLADVLELAPPTVAAGGFAPGRFSALKPVSCSRSACAFTKYLSSRSCGLYLVWRRKTKRAKNGTAATAAAP